MKILYFYQYFSTPKGAWGTRVYDFAKIWVDQGHDVTVVSSIYSKSDLKAKKLVEDQFVDGIKIKVLNVHIDNKQPFLKRIWTFIQYSIMSSWFAMRLPADVVVASSGPITVGIPGLVARYFRGRSLVFEVRDLWPEGAIQMGILKNPILIKIAYWFEQICYRASTQIITLSPGMSDEIKAITKRKDITSITNSANLELFGTPSDAPLPSSLSNRFYAIYTGNIGPVNNSYWLYEAAKCLKEKERSDIAIVLIGEGQWREKLQENAKLEKLENLIFLNIMPKTKLVAFIQNANVSLVPLKGVPVLDTSSPNKFFESLAAGVPVIQNTNGWMRDFLELHKVGFTLDPNNASALAQVLIELESQSDLLNNMGIKAKQLAIKYFDKDYLANEMLKVLKKAAGFTDKQKVSEFQSTI